jgi:hypothetical protein
VVGEQLWAAQAVGPAPAPEPAAVRGDGGLADQLVTAAKEGDGAAVARLLGAGADPNAWVTVRNPSGEVVQTTALAAAAAHGQLEVLRLLLVRGAAVDAVEPVYGWTAFHNACVQNEAECVEELARAGCDVGIKEKNGFTGRELAEVRGCKEAARRLQDLARQPFVGVLVELAGLVGAAEHNGKRATVMSERSSRGHHTSVFLPRARILSAVCFSIEERYVWQSNGCGIDHPLLPSHTPPSLRCQVPRSQPEQQRSTLEPLEPPARGGGARKRMDVRPANFVLAHLPAGTRCASWPGGCDGSRRCSPVFGVRQECFNRP